MAFPVQLRAALTGAVLAEAEVQAHDKVASLRSLLASSARFDLLVDNKAILDHELLGETGIKAAGVAEVLYFPDPTLAGACGDSVSIWGLANGDTRVLGHMARVRSVVVLPDQHHVLTGCDDAAARLWNLERGECVRVLPHHAAVTDVACSSDGELLLTNANGVVRVWTVLGSCIWVLDSSYVLQAQFLPGSHQLLLVFANTTDLQIWRLSEAEPTLLRGHSSVVLAATCSKDGRLVFSGSLDCTARLWDRTGQCLQVLSGHFDGVRALAMSSDLVATASGLSARVWSAQSGSCECVLSEHGGSIHTLQFNRDGRLLLAAYGCGREVFAPSRECSGVRLWCTRTLQCLASVSLGRAILSAKLLDGQSILLASADRIELWQQNQRSTEISCCNLRALSVL